MNHRKGIVSVLLGLGILAVSIALSTPRTALSQGGPGNKDVRVINSAAEAVPVNVVKSPARKPWQASVDLDMVDGQTSKLVALPEPPPGKRIVIEFGSAQLLVLKSQVPNHFAVAPPHLPAAKRALN